MSEDEPDSAGGGDAARKPRRSRSRQANGAIDIREALFAPVRVKRDDTSEPIDAYEAMLRQHVKKSIVEKCVASIRAVADPPVCDPQTVMTMSGIYAMVPLEGDFPWPHPGKTTRPAARSSTCG